jgi:hypothetical protein
MGDYSSVCAVSGLPIMGSVQVVVIPVERYRWWKSEPARYMYVPRGFPFFGEYNNCGGLEERPDGMKRPFVFVHRAVWDSAENYFHYLNITGGWHMPSDQILADVERHTKASPDPLPGYARMSAVDRVYAQLRQFETRDDVFLTLREMFNGKNVSKAGATDNQCFLAHNAFAREICKRIMKGWASEDTDIVRKLAALWQGQAIVGRYIMPPPYVEQYPKYGQRIKLLRAHLALAEQLGKGRR